MIDLINTKKGQIILICFHFVLGLTVKYAATITALVYAGMFAAFCLDVFITRDRDSRAGFYCLYLMGMEMVYRMVGAPFSWELGKYVSILILLVGILFGRRKYISYTFVFLLILLIPAIVLTEHPEPDRVRKMIMFGISGPLSLVFSGLYFYHRPILEETFVTKLKFSFLPAITICVALSVVANIADLEFTSLQSNSRAAGGFGANQVSTILGWFILLALLLKFNKNKLTPFEWLDWVIIFYLVLRGFLTFSRGGIMGSIMALMCSMAILYVTDHAYRKLIKKLIPYILLGVCFLVGVFYVANNITGGMLLFRYKGYSTSEMKAGTKQEDSTMLTGRDDIMGADMIAFKENPLWGTGVGMAEEYRIIHYGAAAAAHTEYTRLLSEHGFFGILFMLIGMIILPIVHFFREKGLIARYFFIAFLFISMFTMFHAAMRLAMPGILFGIAFVHIIPKVVQLTDPEETSPIPEPNEIELPNLNSLNVIKQQELLF